MAQQASGLLSLTKYAAERSVGVMRPGAKRTRASLTEEMFLCDLWTGKRAPNLVRLPRGTAQIRQVAIRNEAARVPCRAARLDKPAVQKSFLPAVDLPWIAFGAFTEVLCLHRGRTLCQAVLEGVLAALKRFTPFRIGV